MTFRERLADWISGGRLSLLKDQRDTTEGHYIRNVCLRHRMQEALDDISACETPSANATVRRMARIAREATE